MEPGKRRVALEVAIAAVVGVIPSALYATVNRTGTGLAESLAIVVASVAFVANPGYLIALGLVGAKWPGSTTLVSAVSNMAILGGSWFVVRTRPKVSRLRKAVIAMATIWLLLSVVFLIFASVLGQI